jgi:2-polyprenyl-3-methyl-5-hydroxy-6-metoxy-1,4-benzoquinol methylase
MMSVKVKQDRVEHEGPVVASVNAFKVIDCECCGFRHVVPIPSEEELISAYRHEYFTQEKPLYLERSRQDLPWWNTVYTHRYEILEKHLPATNRKISDIGSGPGFFLLTGQKRGWQVQGVEPSIEAATRSKKLGLDIENIFFSVETAQKLGTFDAINMGEVLEHIRDPAELLKLAHSRLNPGGLICIIVPNDFNPFQMVLEKHLGFKSWWVAPPHRTNYFNFKSLKILLERCGFEVLHQESTFPIDIFLLMGENYIGSDAIGRECHGKRMRLEINLFQSGAAELMASLYSKLSELDLGREIVMIARRV